MTGPPGGFSSSSREAALLSPLHHLEGIGSHEDLLAATLDHVEGFYGDWYAPNNATLVLAGDISAAEAKPLVEKYFGKLGTREKVL